MSLSARSREAVELEEFPTRCRTMSGSVRFGDMPTRKTAVAQFRNNNNNNNASNNNNNNNNIVNNLNRGGVEVSSDGGVGVGVDLQNGVTSNKSGIGGIVNLAIIETEADLPPSVARSSLQPPTGGLTFSPSDEPIRRRLSSNVMVTKKRIRNAKASPEVTMMHIFRSFVGAGILSMPYAFSHAGVLFAPIGIVAVGAVVVFRSGIRLRREISFE